MRFFLHSQWKASLYSQDVSCSQQCGHVLSPIHHPCPPTLGKRSLTVWTGHTFENHQRRPAFPYSHTNKNEFISVSIQKNFNLIIETWGKNVLDHFISSLLKTKRKSCPLTEHEKGQCLPLSITAFLKIFVVNVILRNCQMKLFTDV